MSDLSDVVLSVDPGTRGCGGALWVDRRLVAAGFAKSPHKKGSGPRECAASAAALVEWASVELDRWRRCCGFFSAVRVLVLEWPQIYQRADGKSKGDPNDILPVAAVDGAIAALLPRAEVLYILPHDWKQSIEKPETVDEPYIIKERLLEPGRLAPEEIACIDWTKNVRHSWDVADGVAVGMKILGRFEKKRNYPSE